MPELATHSRFNKLHKPDIFVVVPSVSLRSAFEPSRSICRCKITPAGSGQIDPHLAQAIAAFVQVFREVGVPHRVVPDGDAVLDVSHPAIGVIDCRRS